MLILFYRQVVVGEHVVAQEVDCVRNRRTGRCEDVGLPPIQKLGVNKVTLHENWNPDNFRGGSDIALVRVATPIVLFYVCMPSFHQSISIYSTGVIFNNLIILTYKVILHL